MPIMKEELQEYIQNMGAITPPIQQMIMQVKDCQEVIKGKVVPFFTWITLLLYIVMIPITVEPRFFFDSN